MRKLSWNNLKVTKVLTKLKCIYQFFRLFLFLFRRLRHIVSKLNLLFIVKTIFQERVFIFNASLRRINEFNTNKALFEWMRNEPMNLQSYKAKWQQTQWQQRRINESYKDDWRTYESSYVTVLSISWYKQRMRYFQIWNTWTA